MELSLEWAAKSKRNLEEELDMEFLELFKVVCLTTYRAY